MALSDISSFTVNLLVSCSFAKKCFKVAAILSACNPWMKWDARVPVRYGSSEKASKFLPPNGDL